MEKHKKGPLKLVGLKLKDKTSNANGQSNMDCGNLWQEFYEEKVIDHIPNKLTDDIYAVYYDYEKDENAPFCYFIGCQVDEASPTPEGLEEILIPAQTYKKVIAKGEMIRCLTDAWKGIWSSDINRKFGFDFEVYDEKSMNWGDVEVPIFVSIDE